MAVAALAGLVVGLLFAYYKKAETTDSVAFETSAMNNPAYNASANNNSNATSANGEDTYEVLDGNGDDTYEGFVNNDDYVNVNA